MAFGEERRGDSGAGAGAFFFSAFAFDGAFFWLGAVDGACDGASSGSRIVSSSDSSGKGLDESKPSSGQAKTENVKTM